MRGEIITLEKWYEKLPNNFSTIFDGNPLLNMLFPDSALVWMANNNLSASKVVFAEALHKFASRYVMQKYDSDTALSTIEDIRADIIATSLAEWNKFQSLKEVINGELSLDKIKELFGNYNITKIGGWTDKYNAEDYKFIDTWTRETERKTSVSNFESELKPLSTTETDYEPSSTQQTTHERIGDPNTPSMNRRSYDGGETNLENYKEFGYKNGEFYNTYYKFILSFPNSVDMFLNLSATSFLLEIYNPTWLYN